MRTTVWPGTDGYTAAVGGYDSAIGDDEDVLAVLGQQLDEARYLE